MYSVDIAVEDSLSEGVARRLIDHIRRDWTVGTRYPLKRLPGGRENLRNAEERRGLSGYGQIKVQLPAFNNLARLKPVLVLTDLDVHVRCPGDLWGKWTRNAARNPNLVFRVAVKEVEGWLLADRENMSDFLAVPVAEISPNPESLSDPKIEIVNLARKSTSTDVQHSLVPLPGSTAEVGRSFDSKLIHFARDQWDIDEAVKRSRSLSRAVSALRNFKFTPHA